MKIDSFLDYALEHPLEIENWECILEIFHGEEVRSISIISITGLGLLFVLCLFLLVGFGGQSSPKRSF